MPWTEEGRKAAAERMRKLHADPAFRAKRLEAASRTLKAQNADPEFVAKKYAARHPVTAKMTDAQREAYKTFTKSGYTAAEALAAVTGTTSDKEARP